MGAKAAYRLAPPAPGVFTQTPGIARFFPPPAPSSFAGAGITTMAARRSPGSYTNILTPFCFRLKSLGRYSAPFHCAKPTLLDPTRRFPVLLRVHGFHTAQAMRYDRLKHLEEAANR